MKSHQITIKSHKITINQANCMTLANMRFNPKKKKKKTRASSAKALHEPHDGRGEEGQVDVPGERNFGTI